MDKLIIAYCVENQYVAAKIATILKDKMAVEKTAFDSNNGIEALKKSANGNAHRVLLLISDNFLKSEKCMNEALPYIQSLGASNRLIPVTTEGIYPNADSGQMSSVPTSFDRVSNVIQYMNFWQDRYLELRKLKADADDAKHNEKVRVVRAISSEIGELLRYFRTMAFFSYDQFKESNFIILYRVLGIEITKEMEEAKKLAVSHTLMPVERPELAYSNGSSLPEAPTHEEEKPPMDLSAIPGIAQLSERLNVKDSSIGRKEDAVIEKKESVVAKISEETKAASDNMVNAVLKEETKPIVAKVEAIVNEVQEEAKPVATKVEAIVQEVKAEAKPIVAKTDAIVHEVKEKAQTVDLKSDVVVNEILKDVKPVAHISSTLEEMIQGFRTKDKSAASNGKDKMPKLDEFIVEKTEDIKPEVEKKGTPSLSGFTLEQILKDDEMSEIMKKQTTVRSEEHTSELQSPC